MSFMSLLAALGGKSAAPLVLSALTSCTPAAGPAPMEMQFVNVPPEVTHNLDHEALGKFSTSTTFSHNSNETFLTGGITESNIKTQFNVSFRHLLDQKTQMTCLYVDKVTLTLSYAPVVHMASNFPKGSCRFATTWEHELRHVNTDLITLKETQGNLEQAARAAVARLGAMGPLPYANVPGTQQEVIKYFESAVQPTFKSIDAIRLQRQQLIDTRQEYMRLSNACPNER